jgi:hypothetical protein
MSSKKRNTKKIELDLKLINGNEIIKFLNKQSIDNEDLCDISISPGSFVFESQKIEKDEYLAEGFTHSYILNFTGSYNNWGTEQEISGNFSSERT